MESEIIISILNIFGIVILFYFIFLNGFYCFQLISSIKAIRRGFDQRQLEDFYLILQSDSLPTIAFIVPAFNEEVVIESTVRALLQLTYRYKQIIIVNDGSTDLSLDILKHQFSLVSIPPFFVHHLECKPIRNYYQSKEYPNLLVIDKENGGCKADAINAGLNACTASIFVVTDCDTLFEDTEFNALIRPFLMDAKTVVSGATVRIANDCKIRMNRIYKINFPKTFLGGMQCIEYLRAFYIGRMSWGWSQGPLIVSGAFGLFKTEDVVALGGFDTRSLAEDMELIVRIHSNYHKEKKDYQVAFVPNPIVWTEVPEDLRSLASQRERWHRGLIQTLKKYKTMFFNPRYGKEGMITFPFYVLGEKYAPVVEFTGYILIILYYLLGELNWNSFLLFFSLAWGLTTILSFASILMEELTFRRYPSFKNIAQLLVYAVLENFGYRQLTVWWRIKGFFRKKGRKHWENIKRVGFGHQK